MPVSLGQLFFGFSAEKDFVVGFLARRDFGFLDSAMTNHLIRSAFFDIATSTYIVSDVLPVSFLKWWISRPSHHTNSNTLSVNLLNLRSVFSISWYNSDADIYKVFNCLQLICTQLNRTAYLESQPYSILFSGHM